MQPVFLLDLLRELKLGLNPIHTALETSGYGDPGVFKPAVELADLTLFDLKLTDPAAHRKYTGADNRLILRNFEVLKASGKPFTARMPLIPGVNDTKEHFTATAELLGEVKDRVNVEILSYNPLAGAKYTAVGLDFEPEYDEYAPVICHIGLLEEAGILVRVL